MLRSRRRASRAVVHARRVMSSRRAAREDDALSLARRRALDDDGWETERARGEASSSSWSDVARAVVAGARRGVKCSFRDGVVAVLDGDGEGMTTHAGGETTRRLTAYATSRWRARATTALEIRNAFAETPHYVPRMLRRDENGDASSLGEARVFDHEEDFTRASFDGRLVRATSNGWFESTSLCGCASVRLSSHGLVLEVCYPAQVSEPQDGTRRYVWQKQRFLAARAPSRWSRAAQTLSRARAAASLGAADAHAATDERESIFTVTLPRPTVGGESVRGTPWADDSTSWWASQGLNSYDADAEPFVEWTPECTIWACETVESDVHEGRVQLDGQAVRCVAFLARDGSAVGCCASSDDEYAVVIDPGSHSGEAPRRLRLEEIAAEDDAQPLLQVIERLKRFERALRGTRCRQLAQDAALCIEPADTFAATSMEVVKRVVAHDSASEFVAYADGRVRAVFGDRTMLLFDRPREKARLVLNDGARVTVRVAAPTTAKSYVSAALAFANEIWPEKTATVRTPTASARSAVDFGAAMSRNETWLRWYRTFEPKIPNENHLNTSLIASTSMPTFVSTAHRLDMVAAELAKTQTWFASVNL